MDDGDHDDTDDDTDDDHNDDTADDKMIIRMIAILPLVLLLVLAFLVPCPGSWDLGSRDVGLPYLLECSVALSDGLTALATSETVK